MKKIYTISVLVLLHVFASSQDQQYTQFYANPAYVNPAFAGASVQSRLSAQYRNQWSSIPGGFNAFNISFDQFMPNINSGMGLLVNYDKAGSGGLKTSQVSFQYAYEAKIKRNLFFRPALQFGYGQRSIDFDKLLFYDQMIRDGNPVSIEQGTIRPVGYFDFASGLLLYGPKFWLGVSAFHSNRPNESFYNSNQVPMFRKISAHGGVRLRVRGNSLSRLDQHIVLAANYLSQQNFDQLDLGFYYEFSPVVLGIWYRGLPMKSNTYGYPNHDAVAVLLGFQASRYKFGYSYDITVSSLGIGSTAGSHELSLVYQWSNKHNQRSKKIRIMPCAKF